MENLVNGLFLAAFVVGAIQQFMTGHYIWGTIYLVGAYAQVLSLTR